MISLADFKARCVTDSAENIVNELILADDALHVSVTNREFVLDRLASAFGIATSDIALWVVGSAKLGFSITEKVLKDGTILPRYRPFRPVSDIDIAIVSPKLFRLIWDELCIYAHGHPWLPWNSGKLGDYMVYGWLRPDFFPKVQMRLCDSWWDLFYDLSKDLRFGRRTVRGALFHSVADLARYQRRSVTQCVRLELEKK